MTAQGIESGPVDLVLGAGGPVARALGAGHEVRAQQLEMARAVWETMESRSHLLVEAGTGVGKSFAYLVPAMLRCLRGERVVVATNTISLQEQLIEKDIPLLQGTLGGREAGREGPPRSGGVPEAGEPPRSGGVPEAGEPPRSGGVPKGGEVGVPGAWRGEVDAALVKGRGNYLSVRRLMLASKRQDRLFADAASRQSLHVIEDWAYETTDGTLSTLPQLERPAVWDRVQSDSGNCMGRKCPEYGRCFYQSARRRMEKAKLLICNHALFFADLALRQRGVGFLPKYDHVVLDEAHNVEDVASEHFGLSLPEGRLWRLLSSLHHRRTGRGFLAQVELGDDAGLGAVDEAIRLTVQAETAGRILFEELARLGAAGESGGRVREAQAVANPLSPVMRELALRLGALKPKVRREEDRYELNAYAERAAEIGACCAALIDQSMPGCAYWVDVGQATGARPGRVTIACSPVEVAPLLRQRLLEQDWSVTFTSATLAAGGSWSRDEGVGPFAHTIARLGCEGARTLRLGSPFPLSEQLRVFADVRPGRPPGGLDAAYERRLASAIFEHLCETDGGAFVLFTSLRSLGAMADVLRGPLAEEGITLLAQGRDGPRAEILRRFRGDDRAALFGAASFWQGVDVPGQGLRSVIITRLPFEPPDRPLTQARLELIEQRGGNPFFEESLPRAVMRFKQGLGRVIRSARDSGRVVVLDGRLVTARYGGLFRAALPEGVEVAPWPDPAGIDERMPF
ncbi:MAG: ATP-dependent DNA helicase [Phycisphaerales bacterium JB039]